MNFKHLEDLNISYVQHFTRALRISCMLICAGAKSLVHAIYPDVFVTSASDTVEYMHHNVFNELHDE